MTLPKSHKKDPAAQALGLKRFKGVSKKDRKEFSRKGWEASVRARKGRKIK